MPTGWPPLAHDMAQLAWPAPLPASFFDVEQATSTTSPFTVMSAANTGMASAATTALAATREIRLRMENPQESILAASFTCFGSRYIGHYGRGNDADCTRHHTSRNGGHSGAKPSALNRRSDQLEARGRAGRVAERPAGR